LALVTVTVLYGEIGHTKLLLWFVIICFINILIFFIFNKLKYSLTLEHKKIQQYLTYFRWGTLASGLVWEASGYFLSQQLDSSHQIFISFTLGGLAAGASSSLASDKLSTLFFIVPTKPNRKWMESANKQRTDSQSKVELFKLISDQWRDQFVTSILVKSEGNNAWPIMDSKQCSCGTWLSRVRHKQFFADRELTLLEQAHQDVHLIANEIQLKYSRSDIEADQSIFADFNLAFDKMGKALAQCLHKN
jgi:hypothetical protein